MTIRPSGPRPTAVLAAAACAALLLAGCVPQTQEEPSSRGSETASASSGPEETAHADQAVQEGYALNAEGEDLPVVTMYTDYECPACGAFHPAVEQAAEQLDGEVTLRVKNFPLPMHDSARPAALAVEAAAVQDAGQEYADLVYDDVDEWSELSDDERTERFVELAGEAGLDQERFRRDMGSAEVARVVDEHEQQARDLELQGTPSFVVDGRAIDLGDIRTPEDLRDVLQDAAEDSGSGGAGSGGADQDGTRA